MKDRLKPAAYLLMLVTPLLVIVGALLNIQWLATAWSFVGIPVLDLLIGEDTTNRWGPAVPARSTSTYYYCVPHAYVTVWLLSLVVGINAFVGLDGHLVRQLAIAVSMGCASAFATCAAHEILHRRSRFDYGVARVTMAVVSYGHFVIEHLHHHAHVGKHSQGTVPLRNQSLFSFVMENVRFGYLNSWNIEMRRLRAKALNTLQNRFLQQYVLTGLVGLACFVVWGLFGLIAFAFQAAFAIFALEMIQYLEHYGLERADGEPNSARLSWNNNFFVTNACTLNITRHSDHHGHIQVPFEKLRIDPDGPQARAGYFALVWIAIIPPIWYRIMNKRIPR